MTNTLHFFQIKEKDGRFKDSGQEALVTRGQGQHDKLLSRSCHRKAVRLPKASEDTEVVGGWDGSVGSPSREVGGLPVTQRKLCACLHPRVGLALRSSVHQPLSGSTPLPLQHHLILSSLASQESTRLTPSCVNDVTFLLSPGHSCSQEKEASLRQERHRRSWAV